MVSLSPYLAGGRDGEVISGYFCILVCMGGGGRGVRCRASLGDLMKDEVEWG